MNLHYTAYTVLPVWAQRVHLDASTADCRHWREQNFSAQVLQSFPTWAKSTNSFCFGPKRERREDLLIGFWCRSRAQKRSNSCRPSKLWFRRLRSDCLQTSEINKLSMVVSSFIKNWMGIATVSCNNTNQL